MLGFLKLPSGNSKQPLDLSYARPDYEPGATGGQDRDQLPDAVRLIVYLRNGGLCAYCCRPLVISLRDAGKHFTIHGKVPSRIFQLDHVLAVSTGGRENYKNYQGLCEYHNGFKFKSALIELHGAFQAARLGQRVAADWKEMYRAWLAAWAKGVLLSALPFHWFEKNGRGLPALKLPGVNERLEISVNTFGIEKAYFDKRLLKFMKQDRFGKIKALITPELANHDRAFLK